MVLWPDVEAGQLHGELTFDPELTRGKDVQPGPEHQRRVIELLNENVRLTLDGHPLRIEYRVRELWVRGGATLGDLVVFSAPLPRAARELRVFAGDVFKALIVSVQMPPGPGSVGTTSWLSRHGEWTPVYRIAEGWQAPGWTAGGAEAFAAGSNAAAPDGAASNGAAPDGAAASVTDAAGRPDSLRADAPASRLTPSTDNGAGLAARFVRLGFEHILPGGIDHVLFVAGLVLGSGRRYRRVFISLSLFTLAHTITLALGHFRLLQVPAGLVEPLIALSILLLGLDNLRAQPLALPGAELGRYLVVFCFGLVHGLGFANALSELSFGPSQLLLALFSFNLGVELGQLAVVSLLALVLCGIRDARRLRRYATIPGSIAIALSGLFLIVDRLGAADAAPTSLLDNSK